MTAPFVTVLITTYNYGQFIEQAVDSVLAQEYPHNKIQILVVDDGSTDDTSERVKKYGSRIEYLQKPNGGQASALNLGIARARADIIAFLDADDLFVPEKLARVSEAFGRNPALGMVYHPYIEWHVQTGQRVLSRLPLVSGDARKDPAPFFYYQPYATSSVILRKSSLGPLLPIPEDIRMLADCFLVQLVPLLAPILAIPEPLTLYRIHGNNCYYADERDMPKDTASARWLLVRTVFDAMRTWLARNGYRSGKPPVQYFRNRWYLYEQQLQSSFNAPGRLRLFWFMVRENNARGPIQSWKVTTFNYLVCLLALIFGYKKTQLVYDFLLYEMWLPLWHFLLGRTRPLRHALGLRAGATRCGRKRAD
jgi:glycosyltransferase involved in cell wall biosynthesis